MYQYLHECVDPETLVAVLERVKGFRHLSKKIIGYSAPKEVDYIKVVTNYIARCNENIKIVVAIDEFQRSLTCGLINPEYNGTDKFMTAMSAAFPVSMRYVDADGIINIDDIEPNDFITKVLKPYIKGDPMAMYPDTVAPDSE